VLEIKGQVLYHVHFPVKVPGWLLNMNALLTKKLGKFLLHLNELSGGRENMCLVSGSLRRILSSSEKRQIHYQTRCGQISSPRSA